MTYYIEYIYINNLSINLLICYLTLLASKSKISSSRIAIVSNIGAIFALIYPFIENFTIVLKFLLPIVMVFLLKKQISKKDYFHHLILFYLITFTMGGATILVQSYLSPKTLSSFNFQLLPFAASCASICIIILVRSLIKKTYYRKKIVLGTYEVKITVEEINYVTKAMYDSGNKLLDKITLMPMVIVSENVAKKLKVKTTGEVLISTIGGAKKLPTFKIKIEIYFDNSNNKIYYTKAAIGEINSQDYEVILNSDMIQGD